MTGAADGALSQSLASPKASHGVQKGVGLTIAAIAVGLLTAFSGVVIELAAGFLTDLLQQLEADVHELQARHGAFGEARAVLIELDLAVQRERGEVARVQ